MQYRTLGRSGVRVSVIGFGGWGIGGRTASDTSYGPVDEETCAIALKTALDSGVTFFDTAPAYGDGRSERLIGAAVSDCRDNVVLATKIGYQHWQDAPDFSENAAMRSLEGSLARLGTDRIDLLQLHSPPIDVIHSDNELFKRLRRLKEEGTVRAVGVSAKSPQDAMIAIENVRPDAIQVNFNMLDMRADHCGLFDAASRAGVGVIVRTPLCFGFLSGRLTEQTDYPEGDHRNSWSVAQRKRWLDGAARMRAAVSREIEAAETPVQTALRFCLTPDAVSAVIPGILTPDEASENAAAGDMVSLSPNGYSRVRELNVETDFFLPPNQARAAVS